ncbi:MULTISPECIES: SemiSWEET family sugar transporter [unclassified Enterococcus]|uniref:SemiSWEET family sugar transporter n=1 Tax=unclassified Enterococcus TaxID=2608891 RepID=UPI001CE0DC7E|nr:MULTISPECIES: SemiSWEET transporter [unclassified Enterococcus]MCA5013317.1 SemiSWEET transporter [Enterococcus sp. S23]MCA5016567.1 SemiSWEET transporter [Enterococcus sp. S22(2020)]
MITLLGMIAGICTSISFIPQAIQTIKTKNTEGISLITYILFFIGVSSWVVYGALKWDLAVLLTNVVTLVPCSVILGLKLKSLDL